MVTVHGGSPVRHLQVVTDTLHTSVSLDLTLGRHEEGRAVGLDGGLGGVNQGEAVGNSVLGKGVLLGQVSGSLMDHSAQVSNIQASELASDRGQTDLLLGRLKGGIDGLVGDTGVLRVEGCGPASEHIIGVVKQRGFRRAWYDEGAPGGGGGAELSGDGGQGPGSN